MAPGPVDRRAEHTQELPPLSFSLPCSKSARATSSRQNKSAGEAGSERRAQLRRGRFDRAEQGHKLQYHPAAEQRMSSCLGRAAVPVKRVWRGLSARLRRRRRTTGKLSTYVPVSPDVVDEDREEADGGVDFGVLAGLGRLRKEVRTCEYRDVHVMWEMLSSNGAGMGGGAVVDDDTAAEKGPAPATARRTRRGRKPAPWGRVVAYCCAF